MSPKEIIKRDGNSVPFDQKKILEASYKAFLQTGEGDKGDAEKIAKAVFSELLAIEIDKGKDYKPTVEEIQDLVEKHLIYKGFAHTAKAYILYRKERSDLRKEGLDVSPEVRKRVEDNKKYFKNQLSEFVYYRTYSKWNDALGRRETWDETVDRFMNFMKDNLKDKLKPSEYDEVRDGILNQEVVPSMRLVWAAGPAAAKTNVAAYNCSYVAPTKLKDFGEMMYILMCGAGLGFSAESNVTQSLPQIKKQTGKQLKTHVVEDSKEGWADAFVLGLETWFDGKDIAFDYSKVRPNGARLKTMGGRASGPEPLISLMKFAKSKILSRQGKRLTNLDVHDISCKIGEIVVAGGVRRSALISLTDLDDLEMRNAKSGQFYLHEPQRSMANISAVYNQKPSSVEFLDEWISLMKSGSGERGIWNRGSLEKQLTKRRWDKFKDHLDNSGVNPCGEIILRSREFCNLTSIVVRKTDTKETLLKKIRLATILGTYQATLTNFGYLQKEWKKNCEEEALLGVSFTGYFDNPLIRKASTLSMLRDSAVSINKKYAKRFGINQATAVTSVKPSGNSSQLLDTASGMHPRFAEYYVRRVRISASDPLFRMLKDQGVPSYPEVGQEVGTATTYVLEFPVKSPEGAILNKDVSAIDLLEHWKLIKENYTEHNPSATIYVEEDEWIDVAKWVYQNWDIIAGLTFLPKSDNIYRLAPYEEITKQEYLELVEKVKNVDFAKLALYEKTDKTEGSKEFACAAGGCEI